MLSQQARLRWTTKLRMRLTSVGHTGLRGECNERSSVRRHGKVHERFVSHAVLCNSPFLLQLAVADAYNDGCRLDFEHREHPSRNQPQPMVASSAARPRRSSQGRVVERRAVDHVFDEFMLEIQVNWRQFRSNKGALGPTPASAGTTIASVVSRPRNRRRRAVERRS